ncbi:MAG: glycosyltransferase family 4 protein [Acidimicrobiia bacterium]
MASERLRALAVSQVSVVWGAQLWLATLAPRLRDRGVELAMAGPATGDLAATWHGLDLPYLPLELPPRHGLRRPDGSDRRPGAGQLAGEAVATARSVARIAALVRRHRPDVVVGNDLHGNLDVALAGRLARRPVVLDLHDIVRPGVGRRLLDLAAGLATLTVANSAATASTVSPGRRRAVRVIHPGVDLDRFHPGPQDPALRGELGAGPGDVLVGILGRIDADKGVDVLVEAMAGVDDPRARLVVVGSAYAESAAYEQRVRDRARAVLGDRARFVGRRSDMAEVVRNLDVLVNASRAEPFGLTVVEAQASGVAVVGSAAGGIPEFVEDGRTGLLAPFADVAALRAALTRLVGDPGLRARLGRAGQEQAARFSVESRADEMAAAYRDAASHRSRGRPMSPAR